MVTETVELTGHILDSLILPKVLDEILEREGRFEILEMAVGERPADMSRVRLRVEAAAPEALEAIWPGCRSRGRSRSPRPMSCWRRHRRTASFRTASTFL